MIVYEIMVQMILFTANASFVDKKWRAPRLCDEKYMQNGSFVANERLTELLACSSPRARSIIEFIRKRKFVGYIVSLITATRRARIGYKSAIS